MVATQVIARGLDVQTVQLVLQFDLVEDVDVYLHRRIWRLIFQP